VPILHRPPMLITGAAATEAALLPLIAAVSLAGHHPIDGSALLHNHVGPVLLSRPDNALFIACRRTLANCRCPDWQRAACGRLFRFAIVALAPLVGAFADALPKGKVNVSCSNAIKGGGLAYDAFRSHPRRAPMGPWGWGAAASLAGQVRHPDRAAAGCSWSGQRLDRKSPIASIILGIVAGRPLVGGHAVSSRLLALEFPFINTVVETPPEAATRGADRGLYILAAWFTRASPTPCRDSAFERQPFARPFTRTLFAAARFLALQHAACGPNKLGGGGGPPQNFAGHTTLFSGCGGKI